MKTWLISAATAVVCSMLTAAPDAKGAVDLVLQAQPQTVLIGEVVDVGLYAVSVEGTTFTGMDVVLAWDSIALELLGVVNAGSHSWLLSGFLSDEQLDGLNADCGASVFCDPYTGLPFNDGDALYQALSFSPVTATAEGVLITTFSFQALAVGTAEVSISASAECSPRDKQCLRGDIFGVECADDGDCGGRVCLGGKRVREPCNGDADCPASTCPPICSACLPEFCCTADAVCSVCSFMNTRVLGPGDVTGALIGTEITVPSTPRISAPDIVIPAGGMGYIVVSGEIGGQETFGVTLMVEIVSKPGNTGTIEFTPEPPSDIVQRGDPWPRAGIFTAFDSDSPGFSEILNGSVDDDGSFLSTPLTYSGPLTSFPMESSSDAEGVWNLVLATSAGDSNWEGVETILEHGTVRVVRFGDGDDGGTIDMRDYSELLMCFTDALGSSAPPLYSLAPERRCSVYDFNGDGAIDRTDFASFWGVMSGPRP